MPGRIRTIKPEWLDDELLSMCSGDARTLSVALILLADDYGNGRCHAATLAPRVFPSSGDSQESLLRPFVRWQESLRELQEIRFVGLYELDGQHYFVVRNWSKHQKVNHPGKPLVPPPPQETLKRLARDSQENLGEPLAGLLPDLRPRPRPRPRPGEKNPPTPQPSEPEIPETAQTPEPPRPTRPDPLAEQLNGRLPGQRRDVQALFVEWRKIFGSPNAKIVQPNGVMAQDLATAIDAHGLELCVKVCREALNDGMVSGRDDERKVKHTAPSYIFGNEAAFNRILKAVDEKTTRESAGDMIERLKRKGTAQC